MAMDSALVPLGGLPNRAAHLKGGRESAYEMPILYYSYA